MVLDMGNIESLSKNEPTLDVSWDTVQQRAQADRKPALLPEDFTEKLKTLHVTNGADRSLLENKYKRTYLEIMRSASVLNFEACGDVRWTGEDGVKLAAQLSTCSRLQDLLLGRRGMPPEAGVAIAPALTKCPHLRKVVMDGNNIGNKGVLAFAEAIPECPCLEEIGLAGNTTESEGAMAVIQSMGKSTTLKTINISSWRLGDPFASMVAEMMPTWQVTNMDLFGSNISDDGAKEIATALKSSQMTGIGLVRNKIGNDGLEAFRAALMALKHRCMVDLRDNANANKQLRTNGDGKVQ